MAEDPKPKSRWNRLPDAAKAVAAAIGGLTLVLASLTTLTETGQKAFHKLREIVAPAPAPTTTADVCGQLEGQTIYALTGGYAGAVGIEGLKLKKAAEGAYQFESYFEFDDNTNRSFGIDPHGPNKIHDLIRGDCHLSRIKFTRSVRDGSAQIYDGIISLDSQGNLVVAKGKYVDQHDQEYNWSARIGHPIL